MAADPLWRPPGELDKIEKSKEIVSQLLLKKDLIRILYLFIQIAAVDATARESVTENSQNTCAYPIGASASSRTDECSVTDRYRVIYHPEDILIVGGVAISLYDEAISGIKSQYHNTSTLQRYVEKDTTDIDMIWWPRIEDTTPHLEKNVVTINSIAISSLIAAYVGTLKSKFTDNSIIDIIKMSIPNLQPDITLVRIEVEESAIGIAAGVKKILIYFIITIPENQTEIKLEICDISIHDGASSQIEVDPIHRKKLILKPMEFDPIYCDPYTQKVAFPIFNEKKLYMPNIKSIINQQLFAFKRLLDAGKHKCIINYKRIRYLQLMIFEYVYQRGNEHIRTIFQIPIDSIDNLFTNINSDLETNISEICSRRNRYNRSNLCHTLSGLHHIYHIQLEGFSMMHQDRQRHQMYQAQQMNQEKSRKQRRQPQQPKPPQGGFIKKKKTRRNHRKNKTHKR
jgi:hypothetical protein